MNDEQLAMSNVQMYRKDIFIRNMAFVIALFFVALFASCNGPIQQSVMSDPIGPGYGTIRISTEDEAARTIFPSMDFERHAYHFTKMTDDTADSKPIGAAETVVPENEVFTLEVGYYTVQVDAFHAEDASVPMASGVSGIFYVGSGNNGTIIVPLALNPEFEDEIQGTFTYIIKFPHGAQIVSLTLEQLAETNINSLVELNYELLVGDGGEDTITATIPLDSGYYLLNIRVEIDGKYAGIIETVHIYPASTTVLEVIFDSDGLITTAIYGLELSESGIYTFPGAIQGYEIQYVLTVTVDNIGNQATGKLAVTLSGDDASSFVLSEILLESISVNNSDSFAIKPNTGLLAGTYTAIVIISGKNDISEQFIVSFTVTDPGAPLFEVADNNKTYGDSHEVIVEYANDITPAQAGEFTVHYTGINGTNYDQSTTAPVNIGIYNITVNTTGGSTYNPVSGQSVGTLTIVPKSLTITGFSITKVYNGTTTVTNFGTPSFSGLVYGETATVDTSGITAIYEQETVGTNLSVSYAGSFGITGGTASASNYQITQPDDLTGTITLASPGAPGTPTENSKTHNSVVLNAPNGTDPLFMLEYGSNTVNNATNATWQDELVFSDLSAGTTYYFFVRYKADPAKNNISTASTSISVITLQTVSQDRIEYYWVDQHGSLVTTSGGAVAVAAGATLTITAQSTDYSGRQWYLNGLNTGQSGNTYSFVSSTAGQHIVGLFVEKDGKLYNTNITVIVEGITTVVPITHTVTVDMYDAYGDGWNQNGRLGIRINNTTVDSYTARVSGTSGSAGFFNTFSFNVNSGDEVRFYWLVDSTSNSYQYENSFIVYYTDAPPNPAFFTGSQTRDSYGPTSWAGTGSLLHRVRTATSSGTVSGTLQGTANNTLLDSFTVP